MKPAPATSVAMARAVEQSELRRILDKYRTDSLDEHDIETLAAAVTKELTPDLDDSILESSFGNLTLGQISDLDSEDGDAGAVLDTSSRTVKSMKRTIAASRRALATAPRALLSPPTPGLRSPMPTPGKRAVPPNLGYLEEHCRSLEGQKERAEGQLTHALTVFKEQLAQRDQEIQSLKLQTAALSSQLSTDAPTFNERLQLAKKELSDLGTSELLYVEYKSIPVAQQSLKQYVLVKVHETVQGVRQQYESSQQASDGHKTRAQELEQALAQLRREHERLQAKSSGAEEELARDLAEARGSLGKLREDLSQKARLVEVNAHKAAIFDETHEAYETLKDEHHSNMIELVKLREEAGASRAELGRLQQQGKLTSVDKTHLASQVQMLTQQKDFAEQELGKAQRLLEQTKLAKEAMYEKFMDATLESKSDFKSKLGTELDRLQNASKGEIEHIRTTQRDSYERELRAVRQARDYATGELEKLQMRHRDLDGRHNALVDKHRECKTRLQNLAAELQSELKMKTFELERVTSTHSETMLQLEKHRAEAERLAEKNSVIMKEYYDMKSSSGQELSRLQSSTTHLQEKVQAYEELEQELDMAVLAASGAGDMPGAAELMKRAGPVKQSVALAQRLIRKQNEVQQLQGVIGEREKVIAGKVEEIGRMREALQRVEQPYQCLLNEIRDRDADILKGKAVVNDLRGHLQSTSSQLQNAVKHIEEMHVEMQNMANNRLQTRELEDVLSQHSASRLPTPRMAGYTPLTRGTATASQVTLGSVTSAHPAPIAIVPAVQPSRTRSGPPPLALPTRLSLCAEDCPTSRSQISDAPRPIMFVNPSM